MYLPPTTTLDDFVKCRVDGCEWMVLVRVGYPKVCDDHEDGWGLPQFLEDEDGRIISTRHCSEYAHTECE